MGQQEKAGSDRGVVMDTDGIKRRIGRLDELSRGLAKEVVLMKAGSRTPGSAPG
jgi:hypothetical protein